MLLIALLILLGIIMSNMIHGVVLILIRVLTLILIIIILLPLPSLFPPAPRELASRLKGHRHRVTEKFGHLSPSALLF